MVMPMRRCSRPGCPVEVKPGVLACRQHWYELSSRLRDRLVFAWEQRKAHPEIPELISIHRALLLQALREWGVPEHEIKLAIARAPRALPTACPRCGLKSPLHRAGCPAVN